MSHYSYSSEGALYGVEGLGQAARRSGSAMDAIIKTSSDVTAKFAQLQGRASQARASAPGTNEVRGVAATFQDAAKRATAAKKSEAMAKALAAQGDKRAAAQKAIAALQQARDAIILANKAEKTRLTRALDVMAKQLDSQAEYLKNMADMEGNYRGPTLAAMQKQATAKQLQSEARELRKKSATVAALPAVPPKAPTDAKIAEVASKFNIRTAGDMAEEQRKANSSVLSDLAASPLAQVRDYEGAWQYYGANDLGKLMADLEFYSASMPAALQGAVHGVSDATSIAIMADANAAFERARVLSRQQVERGLIPAGAVLSGLSSGALGQAASTEGCGLFDFDCHRRKYEAWCEAHVLIGDTDAAQQYGKDVGKCKTYIPASPPWTTTGIFVRGGSPSLAHIFKSVSSGAQVVAQNLPQAQVKTPAQPQAEALAAQAKLQAQIDAAAKGPSLADQFKTAAGSAYTTGTAAAAKVPAYVWGLGAAALLGGVYLYTRRESRYSY